MAPEPRRFCFVQLEFPWAIGPHDGRYLIRDHLGEPPGSVVVVRTLGAHQRRLLRRGRVHDAAPAPPPEPVTTSRVTIVDTAALGGVGAARRWLQEADLDALADAGVARLNRVLHAHRVATADPYCREVAREQALATRIGYGEGERVADGRWDEARALAGRGRAGTFDSLRPAVLRPQERLAALLAGRDVALACEELALRARSDADAGRMREAALQLRAAFDAALAELEPWRDQGGLGERLAALRARREEVVGAAGAALEGGLDEDQITSVRSVLGRVEAALRARAALGE